MNKKFLIMGGIAVIFGGLSVLAADFWLKSNVQTVVEVVPAETPAQQFSTIVVAGEPMRYGMTIDRGMVRELPWPQDSLPEGAFATIDDLLDEAPRRALTAIETNEPILISKVTDPSDTATLSRRIEPGMRAMTIRVDDITGVAGFVVPGDRVDIALTRTFTVEDGQGQSFGGVPPLEISPSGDRTYTGDVGSFVSTAIVLENVKILSIGQIADERQSEPVVVRAVTVEVDGNGAKAVSAAQSAGSLSLILRKAGDVAESRQISEIKTVKQPPVGFPPPPEPLPEDFEPQIDRNYTSSFDGNDDFLSGMATVTVRRRTEEETYDVRDEGNRR